MTSSPTPRKDAARNRTKLLDAARDLFSQNGLNASLKEVAHHANVGVGTAYRHFPTKEDLVEALFAEQLKSEIERAQQAAESDDAWAALVEYLEETLRQQADNRGLRALMCPQGSVFKPVQACKAQINPHIEHLIDKAHQQGTLRPDCTARDITLAQIALVGIMDATTAEPDTYKRHLRFLLDGMRRSI